MRQLLHIGEIPRCSPQLGLGVAENGASTSFSTETEDRLDVWCTVDNGDFGDYCVAGAKQGREYGTANIGNTDALKKINDFNWLQERFNEQN